MRYWKHFDNIFSDFFSNPVVQSDMKGLPSQVKWHEPFAGNTSHSLLYIATSLLQQRVIHRSSYASQDFQLDMLQELFTNCKLPKKFTTLFKWLCHNGLRTIPIYYCSNCNKTIYTDDTRECTHYREEEKKDNYVYTPLGFLLRFKMQDIAFCKDLQ